METFTLQNLIFYQFLPLLASKNYLKIYYFFDRSISWKSLFFLSKINDFRRLGPPKIDRKTRLKIRLLKIAPKRHFRAILASKMDPEIAKKASEIHLGKKTRKKTKKDAPGTPQSAPGLHNLT